ncbi:MAG TPA: ABC transporter ATP-binding protein [Terriglobales bacterium]|nr:ABC transporter ATP-binding protein [Terriglobales bacterium]
MNAEHTSLLSLRVSVDYANQQGVLQDVCLELKRGEILGLVGQSGSGKSTIALSILRLLHMKKGVARGLINFSGRNLLDLSEREMRSLRGKEIGLVLQSPLSSLNPVLSIGKQLREAWRIHAEGDSKLCSDVIAQTLSSVALPHDKDFLRRRVSQISVGQAQRVLIAMAVLHHPSLLIADEPTSALDVVTQTEILDLFRKLNQKLGIAILYISHDLLSVGAICDRIAVLVAGKIVEELPVTQELRTTSCAYLQQLSGFIRTP